MEFQKEPKIGTVARRHPLLIAVDPVVAAAGGSVIPVGRMRKGDIELIWEGEVVGAVRLPAQAVGIDRMLEEIREEYGGVALRDLSREEKQRVVVMLNERGGFQFRRSVEDVADALGISRFTVYNYLNAIHA